MMPPTPESDVVTEDETTLKYKEILKSNGITGEVSEVIVKNAGLLGSGFSSISQYVTVKYTNPKLEQLNLFVKAQSSNPSHVQMVHELKYFEKEATFYMKYIPDAQELCKNKGMEGFVDFYPKCYYGDEKIIVLENLVLDKGYELADKTNMQDMEETKIALETLAKHHALGYAMILESGGARNFFQKYKNLDFEAFVQPAARALLQPVIDNGLAVAVRLLEKYDLEGGQRALELLNSKMGLPIDYALKVTEYDEKEDRLLLLNHGDYHTNNMMFVRDKDTRKVLKHMAIDLQITRYNSPGLDLGYYLFTSIQAKLRRSHLPELLNIYLNTLNKHSKDLGHPIDLSYDELYLELRKKFQLGFWLGICVCAGPVFMIFKDLNVEELGDVSNFGSKMGELIQKWIDDNPEKALGMAKGLIETMKEYDQLLIE